MTTTIKRTPTAVDGEIEIYGNFSDIEDLLDIDLTLGQGKRRDDMKWKNKTAPFGAFLSMITDHKVSQTKDGLCFTQGSIVGERRKAVAMNKMDLLVLDMDTGQRIADVRERILQEGLLAIIYTTHSYGSTTTKISKANFFKKMKLDDEDEVTDRICTTYLETFLRYTPEIAKTAKFDKVEHTAEGIQIFVDHAPMEKYRIVFLLDEPFIFAEEAAVQTKAIDKWKKKYAGLADMLDAFYDHSCVDPSRLFYYPTHKKGGEYHAEIIIGEPLRLDEIEDADPRSMKVKNDNAFLDDAGDGDWDEEEGHVYLNDWVRPWFKKHGKRFAAGDFVRDTFADDIRSDNGTNVTTCCPFDDNHSAPGKPDDMGFFAANAGEWTAGDAQGIVGLMKCSHSACKGHKTPHFIDQMVTNGDIDSADDLTPYLFELEGDEEDEDEESDSGDDASASKKDEKPKKEETPPWDDVKVSSEMAAILASIEKMTVVSDINDVILEIAEGSFNDAERKLLTDAIHRYTKIDKAKIEAKLRSILAARQRETDEEQDKEEGFTSVYTSDHFDDQVKAIIKALKKLSRSDKNHLFKTEDGAIARVAMVQGTGTARVDILERASLFVELTNVVKFYEQGSGGKRKQIGAPPDIVTYFTGINKDDLPLPTLTRIVKHPIFTEDGKFLSKSGYDRSTGAYLDIPFKVLPVNDTPTEAELDKAYDLLFDDLYVDFPIKDADDPDGTSSKAHLLSMIMQSFVRDIIGTASTPMYVVNKPTPGAGSGYLMDGVSIILNGERCSTTMFTKNDEENGKVITTKLRANNAAILFFDNVNYTVDSQSLASALTSGSYTGRVLGKSEEITVPMLGIWAMSGNALNFSNEIGRRIVPIVLNPDQARPEERQNFKHKNYHRWAMDHRSELIWAVCTIIQNWVANDMPDWSGKPMGSFETWSQVMGGILECADIEGFTENMSRFRQDTSFSNDEDREFISHIFHDDGYAPGKQWLTGELFDYLWDDDEQGLEIDLYINGKGKNGMRRGFGWKVKNLVDRKFEVLDKNDHPVVVFIKAVKRDSRSGSTVYTLSIADGK